MTTQFTVGQAVKWHYETHRGWGANWLVPATVIKIGRKRIQIAAQLQSGGTKNVWVTPERLIAKD